MTQLEQLDPSKFYPSPYPINCTKCGICKERKNIVHSILPKAAKVLIVGESPNIQEDQQGRMFVGGSGNVLDDALRYAGIKKSEIAFANVVACRPAENRNATPQEQKVCGVFLDQLISTLQPELIVTLGSTALKRIMPGAGSITKVRGSFLKNSEYNCTILPTFHPAYILRNANEKPNLLKDINKVASFIKGEDGIKHVEKKHKVITNKAQLEWLRQQLHKHRYWACDTETTSTDPKLAKIFIVTFSWATNEAYLIDLRNPLFEEVDAKEWLQDVMGNKSGKIYQNGGYDIQCFWTMGVKPENYYSDTMFQHYLLDENDRHGLEVIAAQYTNDAGYDFPLAKYVEENKIENYEDIPPEVIYPYACLENTTQVLLSDGSSKSIAEIVNKQLDVKVMSYNFKTHKVESKRVINWFKNRQKIQEIREAVHGPQPKKEWHIVRTDYKSQGRIYCSPDHPFLSLAGKKTKAQDLKKEMNLVVKESSLTVSQRQAILGSLLGDGCLVRGATGGKHTYYFTTSHAKSQQKYLQFFHKLLSKFGVSKITSHSGGFSDIPGYVFSTRASTLAFKGLHKELYSKGYKRVTSKYLEKLDDLSLAFWYMDDGSLNQEKSFQLATDGFDRKSVSQICRWFAKKYGVVPYVSKRNKIVAKGKGWSLVFRVEDSKILFRAIAQYIHPSMQYKLPVEFKNKFSFCNFDGNSPQVSEIPIVEARKYVLGKEKGIGSKGKIKKKLRNVYYDIEVEDNHNFFANKILVSNCTDADVTWTGHMKMMPEIYAQQLDGMLFDILIPMQIVLAETEYEGVSIDVPYLERTTVKYTKFIEEMYQKTLEEPQVKIYEKNKTATLKSELLVKFQMSKQLIKKYTTFEAYLLDLRYKAQEKAIVKAQAKKALSVVEEEGEETEEENKVGEEEEFEDPTSFSLNIKSPKQMRELLIGQMRLPIIKYTFDKVRKKFTTNPSLDNDVLTEYAKENEFCSYLSQYRKASHLKSTFLDGIKARLVEDKVHTHYLLTGMVTGRTASVNPNLNNIPRTGTATDIKDVYRADTGDWLTEVDGSQQEFRTWIEYSQDKQALEDLYAGYDIHKMTGAVLIGKTLPKGRLTQKQYETLIDGVTKELRQKAKNSVFGLMFGRGAKSIAEEHGITVAEAQAVMDAFFGRYPQATAKLEAFVKDAQRQGFVTNYFGRRRRLPDILSADQGKRAEAERQSKNSPIQGGAADIVYLAGIRIRYWLKQQKLKTRLVLTVYDSLVYNIPDEELSIVAPFIFTEMPRHPVEEMTVPFAAELKIGKNWGSLIEVDPTKDWDKTYAMLKEKFAQVKTEAIEIPEKVTLKISEEEGPYCVYVHHESCCVGVVSEKEAETHTEPVDFDSNGYVFKEGAEERARDLAQQLGYTF